MSKYKLEGEQFRIEDYEKQPAFSSFLPGLAGVRGIPLWVFYTNRGQGINSFGVHNKGNAIMEFNPANTAYENTALKGFRTFLKKDGKFYEPFCSYNEDSNRIMSVEKNRLIIEEECKELGLKVKVTYFVLPTESIGALVRKVDITNVSGETVKVEGLDGITKIIPYGVQNGMYKDMSNLFRSYSEVKNIENKAYYITMRGAAGDSAEVVETYGGYFCCTVQNKELKDLIYDPDVVFGHDTSMFMPVVFKNEGVTGVKAKTQCYANKYACGFLPIETTMTAGETLSFATYIGFAGTLSQLNSTAKTFCEEGYAGRKEKEAVEIAKELVSDVGTSTADKVFDQYVEQCYLDNFLRGGYPYVFESGENKSVVHLFSRKHGDPERDYNFFSIAGEYFSQGNGNFRDVCQNRRSDVFFKPAMGDFNVWSFFNFVQMDGYNPLEIRPCTFGIIPEKREEAVAFIRSQVKGDATPVEQLLDRHFTPGQICAALAENGLQAENEETLVVGILGLCTEFLEAGYNEGYWSDHWDYLMDLVDNYLLIYPDKKKELLLGRNDYRFYDSVGLVRPRRETYVINNGNVRQYGAVNHSWEKENREGYWKGATNWLKDTKGNDITTTLLGKMLTLAVNKFLLLDQDGMGIEMEGGRPGWNDAMNGLPGLFGSGMPETMELVKLLSFLCDSFENKDVTGKITLPKELAVLIRKLAALLEEKANLTSFEYWDKAATLREDFRAEIAFTASGETEELDSAWLETVLKTCLAVVNEGVEKAWKLGNGIMPTYFTHEAVKYEEVKNEDGSAYITPYGMPGVKVYEFKTHVVPYFLEGPAKMLACLPGMAEEKKTMYAAVKASNIYDKKLKMYKTSEPIGHISMEHGRVRAFTPGWQERESVFLHMEYKYILALLKAGLYEEYFETMKDAMIPFQAPEVYGRSILENSSFLASSVNPDENVHGRGFVARLSGSTTEVVSMWISMFLGKGGFAVKDGALTFSLEPKLAGWLFDENGKAEFTLMSKCKVAYNNPLRKNTYGADGVAVTKLHVFFSDGKETVVEGNTLTGTLAEELRNGAIVRIVADCQ